jgi:hypothetical protein
MIGDMRRFRVVLDTTVLVAASRSRRGASFALLRMLRAGRFTALASVPLLLEYEAALKRPAHLAAGGRRGRPRVRPCLLRVLPLTAAL